jgi:hypothetical protein
MADGDLHEGPLADKEKVRKKGLQERLNRRTELSDVSVMLSTRSGRRFFWRLLTQCGIFRSSMTGNNTTFFNEGRRDVGLHFLADSQEFPDLYLLMMRESREPEVKEKEDGPKMLETATPGWDS